MIFDFKSFRKEVESISKDVSISDDLKLSIISDLAKICCINESPSKKVIKRLTFLQQCPEDLLYYIFIQMDPITLLNCRLVCCFWLNVESKFENSIWSNLSKKYWDLTGDCGNQTWKSLFATQYNINKGEYLFNSFRNDLVIPSQLSPPNIIQSIQTQTQTILEKTRNYIAVWPADPMKAYSIALNGNKIYWTDISDPQCINISCLDSVVDPTPTTQTHQSSNSQNTSFSTLVNDTTLYEDEDLKSEKTITTLKGHEAAIGLLLSNHEGFLVSFDDSSTIKLWDLKSNLCTQTFNSNLEHGLIFSLNIYKKKVVTGGKNGKVMVWSVDTGEILNTLTIPDHYLDSVSVHNLLNVSIWGDVVVFGFYDGNFHVHDCKGDKLMFIFSIENGIMSSKNFLKTTNNNNNNDQQVNLDLPNHPFQNEVQMLHEEDQELEDHQEGVEMDIDEDDFHSNSGGTDFSLEEEDDLIGVDNDNFQQFQAALQAAGNAPPIQQPNQHLAPMTMAINGHILLTNGPEPDQLAVWDLKSGEALYTLSESESFEKLGYFVPAIRDIRFGELSRDMIFASIIYENETSFVCWDFRKDKTNERMYKKFVAVGTSRNDFWVCYENIE